MWRTTLMASVTDFYNYLRYEKRYSPHTLLAYQTDIEQFEAFLKAEFETNTLIEANPAMVRSFMAHLIGLGDSPRSVNRKMSALRSYYKHCMRMGTLKKTPLFNIAAAKTAKRLPSFVEGTKVDDLLDGTFFTNDFEGLRDRVIIELLYTTGMRVSELTGLKASALDFSGQLIKVLGKRAKERLIPISPTMIGILQDYINQLTQQNLDPTNGLFYTTKGKLASRTHIYVLVKKYLSQVTTLKKRSPHVLRHTFATQMLNNGAAINDIKEILGHANLAATQVYTHNTIEKLKQAHKKAHPRA